MTAATVANLSAHHFGHVIACNGWRGRLDMMAADRPGWVALTLAALDPADRDVYTVVPLTEPVRIEDDPTPAVVDLLGALRASVEAARARREARP